MRETFDFAQSPSYYLKKQGGSQDDTVGAPEEYQQITKEDSQRAQQEPSRGSQYVPSQKSENKNIDSQPTSQSQIYARDNITSSIETRTDYDRNLMQRRPQ